jgi:calcineurin-like phosphoesterase family protein
MNYWIISDTHFGHERMKEFCGRPDGFEYKILNNINQCLKSDDVLIHLGDICIGNDVKWVKQFTSINLGIFRTWLINGNHDKNSYKWYLNHGFDFVSESIILDIYGKKILFSHMPQKDIGYDINIHGHFHNSDHRRHEPELVAIKNNKQFLVAMEYNSYMPCNLKTIVEKFEKGKRQ